MNIKRFVKINESINIDTIKKAQLDYVNTLKK